jgi:hypothetical protein
MRLSSFTQYYIRKLLRQHLRTFDSRLSYYRELSAQFSTDLNSLVIDTCTHLSELPGKLCLLNTLVKVHYEQANDAADRLALFKLKQQIFELLGIRILTDSVPLLKVVNPSRCPPFTFFLKNKLRQGVRYQNELYGLVVEISRRFNIALHQLVLNLISADIPFVVTDTPEHIAIWVSLRSDVYMALVSEESDLDDIALRLNQFLQQHQTIQPQPSSELRAIRSPQLWSAIRFYRMIVSRLARRGDAARTRRWQQSTPVNPNVAELPTTAIPLISNARF